MPGGFKADTDYLTSLASDPSQGLCQAQESLSSTRTTIMQASDRDEDVAFGSDQNVELCKGVYDGWRATLESVAQLLDYNDNNLQLCREALQQVVKRYQQADGE